MTDDDTKQRAQAFFEKLFAETRKPHCGEWHKSIYQGILISAQNAGLYQPPEKS